MNQAELDLLVLTAQSGNQQAFSLLFKEFHKPLVGFAFRLSNDQELANDAVQDAWIKIAKNLRKLNDPRAFKSWIYKLVRWRLMDLLRKQCKEQFKNEPLEDNFEQTENNVIDDNTLSEAILRLPKLEKQIIHLFYLDEMKITEIAVILEIPTGTVKSRLSRARALLKKKYQQLEN